MPLTFQRTSPTTIEVMDGHGDRIADLVWTDGHCVLRPSAVEREPLEYTYDELTAILEEATRSFYDDPAQPWNQPNEYGERPGDICCQRAVGGRCYEHFPGNYRNGKLV